MPVHHHHGGANEDGIQIYFYVQPCDSVVWLSRIYTNIHVQQQRIRCCYQVGKKEIFNGWQVAK